MRPGFGSGNVLANSNISFIVLTLVDSAFLLQAALEQRQFNYLFLCCNSLLFYVASVPFDIL